MKEKHPGRVIVHYPSYPNGRKKSYPKRVIFYLPRDMNTLYRKVNQAHVDYIERKLDEAKLDPETRNLVIDKISADLRSREVNGVIK